MQKIQVKLSENIHEASNEYLFWNRVANNFLINFLGVFFKFSVIQYEIT